MLNRYHQTMLNKTKILIHIILERKTNKKIAIDSSDDEENKQRRMRQRKNKQSIDEISQGLLIKQKSEKRLQQRISQISLPETEPKKQKKNKSKVRN